MRYQLSAYFYYKDTEVRNMINEQKKKVKSSARATVGFQTPLGFQWFYIYITTFKRENSGVCETSQWFNGRENGILKGKPCKNHPPPPISNGPPMVEDN